MANITSKPKVFSGAASAIHTGIMNGSDCAVEMKVSFSTVAQTQCLWCARLGTDSNTQTVFLIANAGLRFDYGDTSVKLTFQGSVSTNTAYTIKADGNKIYLDGTLKGTNTGSLTKDKAPVVLFGSYSNTSSLTGLGNTAYYTFYYAKIWKGGTLVRDFIPVASGTTIGSKTLDKDAVFDQVNNVLYYYGTTTTETVDTGGSTEPETVEAPTITISTAGSVTLACATDGASIYYTTNGSAPTSSSTKYTAAFTVLHGATVKAVAIKDSTSSDVASKTYTAPEVSAPVIIISTAGAVTISSATSGADIYYTTNGATPTSSSTKFSSSFTVASGTTVKAIAIRYGRSSSVTSNTYTKTSVATPEISVTSAGVVTITCATSGATIYYTTDGSTRKTYSSAFTVESGTTIQAYATLNGVQSNTAAVTYVKQDTSGKVLCQGFITIAVVSDGTSVKIKSTSVMYQLSDSGIVTPTGNWSTDIPAATDSTPFLWTRTVVNYDDGNSTTSYSVSYKGKNGTNGYSATLKSTETLYGVSSSPSTKPTAWVANTGDILTDANKGKFMWTHTTYKWVVGTSETTSETYSVTYIGKDGDNGTSVTIKGSLTNTSKLPTSGNKSGDGYLINGYLWIYTGTTTSDSTHVNGFENVGEIKGPQGDPGTTYYYHVAWANDTNGTGFTTSPASGAEYAYIGTLINTTKADSTSYKDYTWVKVKGSTGMGALEIIVSPDTLTFDSDANGKVSSTSGKTASITCRRDGTDVTSSCSFAVSNKTNCGASVTAKGVVSFTAITSQTVSGYTISYTSGGVTIKITDSSTGQVYYAQVNFSVNLSAFDAGVLSNKAEYDQWRKKLTNNGAVNDLVEYRSDIIQTAESIGLKVSENIVGRRNLLVGSAFRTGDSGFCVRSKGATITDGIVEGGGYDGSNGAKVVSSSTSEYSGVYWSGRVGGNKNIKIEKGATYTISCWVKLDAAPKALVLEVNAQESETSNASKGLLTLVSGTYYNATTTVGSWALYTATFKAGDTYEYVEANVWITSSGSTVNAIFSRPMLEKGSSYSGWTLSPDDSDAVTQNALLDTGIDIENKKVTVTADNFVVKNNDGVQTVLIDSNGKLTSLLVDAKTVVTEGLQANTIDAEDATIQNLNVTNGKFSGNLNAIKGTFKSLSCVDGNGNTVGTLQFGSNDTLSFDGDLYSQGTKNGRSLRYYASDIWCRGNFGHRSRVTAVVTDVTMSIYTQGIGKDPMVTQLEDGTTTSGGTYYKVPLYSNGNDASGCPIDMVVINSAQDRYYQFTNVEMGKQWTVVNANNDQTIHFADIAGWCELQGGNIVNCYYVAPKFIRNGSTTVIGAGVFWTGKQNFDW